MTVNAGAAAALWGGLVLAGLLAAADARAQGPGGGAPPFFDDGFVAPTASTLARRSLSVATVDLFGVSVRFAPTDRLQLGVGLQAANSAVLERFEAVRTGGSQYRGSARLGAKVRLTARHRPVQLAIIGDVAGASWQYGTLGWRVLAGLATTVCVLLDCRGAVSLSGRAGRHLFDGGFDYGAGQSYFVFEYGASFAAALVGKLQAVAEAEAFAATGCEPYGRFGCGAADPLVVAGGLRWWGSRGAFASAGVGRVFRKESATTAALDESADWVPFLIVGYTWAPAP